MKTENPETKSADTLARELAERCAKTVKEAQDKLVVVNRCEEMLTNRLFVLNIKEIILRETKLRELCAVAEALRLALPKIWPGEEKDLAKQALAALDGGRK